MLEKVGILLRVRGLKIFLLLYLQRSLIFFLRIIVKRKGLPPAIRLYQYNRTHLTHPKGSDNKSFLSVQLLQIVYQTDLLLRLCQQTGKFLSGNTVYHKRSLLPDKRINNCQITYFFVNHLFFITLLTTRTEDTSLFVEVKTSTFHT